MKLLFFVLSFFIFVLFAKSQDTIVQMNGELITAKVLEITPDYVKYKNYYNQDGPLISIRKSQVYFIIYENGIKDILNQKPATEENNTKVEYNKIDKDAKPIATTVTYSKVEYKREISDNEIYNLVKANPLLIFYGEIPIYYERRLTNHLSAEIGAGVTLTDFYTDVLVEENYSNIRTKVGYSFCASMHFFPSKNYKGLEELYFSPEFKIKKYLNELYEYYGDEIDPDIPQSRLLTDFQIKLGFIGYWADNVCVDYYCGIGIRNRKIKEANVYSSGNVHSVTLNESEDLIPCISAGIKIGFGW